MNDFDSDLQQSTLLELEPLTELIGHIHDAAADPNSWPAVLHSLERLLRRNLAGSRSISDEEIQAIASGDGGQVAPAHWTSAERKLWQILTPHFTRADAIRQQINTLETERNMLDVVLDRLPLGSALIDECGRLIYANREFLDGLKRDGLLRISNGALEFTSNNKSGVSLMALIKQTIDGEPGQPYFRQLDKDKSDSDASVFISRSPESHPSDGDTRLLVCVARRFRRELSLGGLISQYGLTQAEARLAQKLAHGSTLDTYAEEQGISSATVKKQLKAVFSKTGVNRQAELVATLYASPLWLDEDRPAADAIHPSRDGASIGHDAGTHSMTMPDGRRLCWSDIGDPNGKPVLMMHGVAGSRHSHHPEDLHLLNSGLRLIIPERPGSGDSDPQPGRQIADWAADMRTLTEHLALPRFAVLGYSGGTPYALAVATAMPDRVSHIALVAAMPPFRSANDLGNYAAMFRVPLLTARVLPGLLPSLMRVVVRGIQKSPYLHLEQSLAKLGTDTDRATFLDPLMRQAYIKGLLSGTRAGEQELVREILLLARDWRMDFSALHAPVRMWHGTADRLVSPDGAHALARLLGNPTLHMIDDAGHYVLFSHWQILCSAISSFLDE